MFLSVEEINHKKWLTKEHLRSKLQEAIVSKVNGSIEIINMKGIVIYRKKQSYAVKLSS